MKPSRRVLTKKSFTENHSFWEYKGMFLRCFPFFYQVNVDILSLLQKREIGIVRRIEPSCQGRYVQYILF